MSVFSDWRDRRRAAIEADDRFDTFGPDDDLTALVDAVPDARPSVAERTRHLVIDLAAPALIAAELAGIAAVSGLSESAR